MSDDLARFKISLDGLLAGAHRQVEIIQGMQRFADWLSETHSVVERHAGHFAPKPLQPQPQEPAQVPPATGDDMQAWRAKIFERQGD